MADLIEKGFEMVYSIHLIRSLKVVEGGDYQGNKYNASVQFKAINVERVDDEKLGLNDKETIISFKIPCEDKDLKRFNSWLRGLDTTNKPLIVKGGLPRDAGKDTFTVTSYQSALELMVMNGSPKEAK